MKTTLLTMLVALMMGGCVTVKYSPETKEIIYQRFGDQKMSGVIVEMYPDGRVDVLLEAQQSEARMFQDALSLVKAGMEMAKQ
jgi:acylphosphatase